MDTALRGPKLAAEFPQLQKLELCNVPCPIDLSPLAGLKLLESLSLMDIKDIPVDGKALKSFTSLGQINTLTELDFMESNVLDEDDVGTLATFQNLRSLGFCGCRGLAVLGLPGSIAKLEWLERLDLCDVPGSGTWDLGDLPSLKYLNLAEQKLSMDDFKVLSMRTSLQELVVDNSENLNFSAGVRWFCTRNPTVAVRHPREDENVLWWTRLKTIDALRILAPEDENVLW